MEFKFTVSVPESYRQLEDRKPESRWHSSSDPDGRVIQYDLFIKL